MSLATLKNVPIDETSLSLWSFANDASHKNIIAAIQRKTGKILAVEALDPIADFDLAAWALRHQAAHNSMNAVSGIQGSDYTQINFNDPQQMAGFISLHANEHLQNENFFGVQ